ncbi:MarR family transcriptional regulator [uncultured Ralstonia sp.]|jgi:DNA-binding MarR family transcriptional regulator|uniref:MarR family winged helix-turn-helix transcriptional regulator n=1 Tax=Ralstonia sp. TaxID=54061 RepID=UPI001EA46720|nr:MarR family transcriptional regulator [uncultured Ralstonia sp.]UCF26045.1 MAG: MarR family transcriptional regulator [Ralstonia sp.]
MKHYNRDNFQVMQSVGFHINRARNLTAMELDDALKPLDITSQQMGILLSVLRGLANTPYELSKLLGMDTGLMTRTLDKLEQKGLLVRSRNIEDRRVINLELTAKGADTADQVPDIASEVLNRRLQRFTEAEFKEFLRLLKKFAD